MTYIPAMMPNTGLIDTIILRYTRLHLDSEISEYSSILDTNIKYTSFTCKSLNPQDKLYPFLFGPGSVRRHDWAPPEQPGALPRVYFHDLLIATAFPLY